MKILADPPPTPTWHTVTFFKKSGWPPPSPVSRDLWTVPNRIHFLKNVENYHTWPTFHSKNAKHWVCYSLVKWKYKLFLISQLIMRVTIYRKQKHANVQYLSAFSCEKIKITIFQLIVMSIKLQYLSIFWRKIIGLPLLKIADFWLNLNKNHRVTPCKLKIQILLHFTMYKVCYNL